MNVSSDEALKSVISAAGYNGDKMLARANEADIKAELRARTQEAKKVGLCGVPSYRVFRRKSGEGEDGWKLFGDMVWGQDELAVVEDLIVGWHGDGVAEISRGAKGNGNSRL